LTRYVCVWDRYQLLIDYAALDELLSDLSKKSKKLTVSTISAYMGLVRAVLIHAAPKEALTGVATRLPSIEINDRLARVLTIDQSRKPNKVKELLIA